jgi:hypothetical protein
MVGICVKCVLIIRVERHHCLPRKWFRRNNVSAITLCHECHALIHKILPDHKRLSKRQYLDIHRQWLQGKNPMVIIGKEKETDYNGIGIA